MCLDRYGSTLFAASTDSRVYLYTVQGSSKHPSQLISVRFFIISIDILQGVKRKAFNAFDFRITASPVSDHVMFGGGDSYAVVWDLQNA
ncbi:unnamed protein product [Gongylonema pulchrum]|uniref:WD_REPEATS_REGION domain-containing protein n=1 Tax=Gongylonema pulchrum TaxID=637853 RepID=A0A183DCV3_9BILA|nr:unnamed protein product [Gongylonema pulchrum]